MTATTRRRNRLYLAGALPAVLLLLVSGRAGLVLMDQSAGISAYAAGRYADAGDDFGRNRVLNPVQTWLAPFNQGAARFSDADYEEAVSSFEAALVGAPAAWECAVRNNLALTHEAIGDRSDRDGERQAARTAWAAGRETLTPCVDDSPVRDPAQVRQRDTAVVIDRRLIDKLGDPSEPASNTKPPTPSNDDDVAKAQELAQLNERARDRRRQVEQRREEREREQEVQRQTPPDEPPPVSW